MYMNYVRKLSYNITQFQKHINSVELYKKYYCCTVRVLAQCMYV